MAADAVMPISVVIERRDSKSAWQDFEWRPLGVLPQTAVARGQVLACGEGWNHIHGGVLDLELFRGETEGYLTNLSQEVPVVFVVLRRKEGAEDGLDYAPFLVTVCPYEAMGYTTGGDDIVEGVAMPPEITVWLREFVTAHHVDVPFQKRKNKRHQDDYGGNRPRRVREEELW
jgi:Protein of unknown function (DUF3305)